MEKLLQDIGKIDSQLWQFLGEHESWLQDPAKCSDIQQRLVHFNSDHQDDPEHIDAVVKALVRGLALMKASVQWDDPVAGNLGADATSSDKARGIQWRLVMTYGGFETVVKTLMNCRCGLGPQVIKGFTQVCKLDSYTLLNPPARDLKNLDKWISNSQTSDAILDFLGVVRGDAQMIRHWLVEGETIKSWDEAVRLAKALRNASAHGALSANKVREWGLKDAMRVLTLNLAEVGITGLQKLGMS